MEQNIHSYLMQTNMAYRNFYKEKIRLERLSDLNESDQEMLDDLNQKIGEISDEDIILGDDDE